MFANLVPVTRERHGNKRVRSIERFDFASRFHVASLMMHEFVRATSFYPIVFIDDREQGGFKPVALLGLESDENLCIDPDTAAWLPGAYIPAIIRRYPFALASTDKQGEFAICIDEGAGLLSESDGLPLFDAEGAATETLDHVKRFLGELQQMDAISREFCGWLERHNMLKPLNLRVRVGETTRDVAGSYIVNEERLESLSDELFLELRRRRFIAPIHAHLTSLAQIDRLVRIKEARLGVGGSPSRPRSAARRTSTGRPRSPRKAASL
jgi:hypothetical protein